MKYTREAAVKYSKQGCQHNNHPKGTVQEVLYTHIKHVAAVVLDHDHAHLGHHSDASDLQERVIKTDITLHNGPTGRISARATVPQSSTVLQFCRHFRMWHYP